MTRRVLFLCTNNAVRSPMAEALFKHTIGQDIYVQSAGIHGSQVHPFAVGCLHEAGLDISTHNSRAYEDLNEAAFDLIIALSKPAFTKAREIAAATDSAVEYWEVPDPPGEDGPRDQIMGAYRAIKGDLERHIHNRFGSQAAP